MSKLLAIDDESEFTKLIQSYFTPRGFEVLVAHDGDRGLTLAKKEQPDVCLIDLKMPGLRGDEVLRQILIHKPDAKCIMITASEGEGKIRSQLKEMGAYVCFDKPLSSLKELEIKIKEAIET